MGAAKGQRELKGRARSGQAVRAGFLEEGAIRGLKDQRECTRGRLLESVPGRENDMCNGPEARGAVGVDSWNQREFS